MIALVVDDSRTMRTVEKRALEAIGWQVAQAENGQAALEVLSGLQDCKLMLVDWQMPVMDGLEFVRAVRANPAHTQTQIIMVSSNAVLESIQQALDAGANDFVMKPFTIEALVERVQGAFNG